MARTFSIEIALDCSSEHLDVDRLMLALERCDCHDALVGIGRRDCVILSFEREGLSVSEVKKSIHHELTKVMAEYAQIWDLDREHL